MPPWKTKPLLTAAVSGRINSCVAAKNAGYADGAVKAGDVGGKPFAGRKGNGVLATMKIQSDSLKTRCSGFNFVETALSDGLLT